MKKKVFSLMMTLLLAFIGVAKADVVEIGDGTGTTYYFPIDNFFNYSCTQQIYTADEIGTAGTITSISFYYNYGTAYTANNVTMYMKNVSRSSFASTSDYEPLALGDIVWTGAIAPTAAGWYTFTLDTPFEYNGTDNLLVAFFDGTSGYPGTSYTWRQTTSPNSAYMALRYYSDSSCPDPYNLGSYSGSKTWYTYRANVQIDITPAAGGGGQPATLLVHDGTTTNSYVPVYGFYADAYLKAEFVYPASELSAMNGGTINGMTFYATSPATEAWTSTWQVFVSEVADASINDFYGPGTVVYEGILDGTGSEMTINFTTPYQYNGGNLLVGVYNTTTGNYKSVTWAGETVDGASVQGYNYSSASSITATQRNFLPKTNFDYITAGGGTGISNPLVALQDGVEVDTVKVGPRPNGHWMEPFTFQLANNGTAMTVTDIDWTPNDYFTLADEELLPFDMAHNDTVDVRLNTGNATNNVWQMVALYGTGRTAAVWYITAEPYDAATPDVWELACEEATSFPFVEVPATAHNVTLYDNYTLPFPEIPEGYDAVYKLEFEHDMMLNAEVTSGADGKVALYTENFYGEGGPMATNNYNGPLAGNGGAAGAPFEAQIGEGTSTTGYFPFYTLYNYSIAENLFLATELAEAGVTTAPMTSLSWYATNAPGYAQQGISIWMANVEDEALTTTSHIVTDMTLVYTGAMTPEIGWNEFAFNEGSFAWDGHSNVLIYCQRNNGAWNSTVNWQATSGMNFTCQSYRYQDSGAYDPTIANTMYTASVRPNVIMKATGRATAPAADIAYGPVITDAAVEAGTYYLVASSTDQDFEVTINAVDMPCPDLDGFAFNEFPADDEDEIEPASVTLQWMNPAYATSCQVFFGSTYYPEPGHMNTVISDVMPVNGPTGSFTVRNLWNNTNYFWYVVFYNDGACTEGVESPHWGFTTHLNVPHNLTAVDYTVFDDQTITLNWTAVVDRTYRQYFIYRDGVKVGETQMNNINNTTYTDGPLAYNMGGYTYYVTAIYDEGESAPSNTVNVKVSGYGTVDGHVYEQDGETGIANATVTMVGTDEFGDTHTHTATTNYQGYYSISHVQVGSYDGQAACNGYQTIDHPVQGNPIAINYNQTTSPIDYMLDENFDPVCQVIAEYYPDSLDPNSPYVKVYWGCGLPGSEIIEPFETGDFSLFDWNTNGSYPWEVTTTHPYEGTYCMRSTNYNVASSTSSIDVTVDIPHDGIMSFYGYISSESSWDYGYFYIDGVQKGAYTGAGNSWGEKKFDITEGTHNFKWEYTKDGSVNSNEDRFYVDYICFYKQPEPAQPGWHTYCESEFNNALGSTVGTSRWAYEYPVSVLGGYAGFTMTKVSLFSDNMYSAVGGNYTCVIYRGGNEPMAGEAISTITVDVPQNLNAWVDYDLTTPVPVTGTETLWVVWTANTHLSDWPAGLCGDQNDLGNWWNAGLEQGYTWEHNTYGTYTMRQYFTNRAGQGFYSTASNMAKIDAPTVTMGTPVAPVKGQEVVTATCANPNAVKGAAIDNGTRRFSHYRVYRTNCYNDGPYTLLDEMHGYYGNTRILSCELYDTVYIDTYWNDPQFTEPGIYKWGVGCVYVGNRGEEIAGPIHWAQPSVNGTRAEQTYDFDDGSLQGWTNIDADGDGNVWVSSANPGIYHNTGVDLTGTGHNSSAQYVISGSYANQTGQALYPDNYLVSPQIALGGSITFYACAQDASYAAEHFGVAVSTTGNTSASSFTTIQEWTMTAKGEGAPTRYTRDGGLRQGSWYQYTVDLSSYSGLGYVAIRHFNCSDEFILNVDDITISTSGGPTPPAPGTEGLQEPRESEIVWSNCLDKDMYLSNVDVTVLLNSADSPEGTVVSFRNYNEAEQQMYPVAPITLDETGFYAFDTFRRGAYAITVEKEGYEPIYDSINLIDNPNNFINELHLRYVMIEILYGVENVYVSRTGWAMWDDSHNNPGGGGGGGGQGGGTTSFTEDFEGGLSNWTLLDADGDGLNWYHSSQSMTYACYDYTGWGHNESDGFAVSSSYTDCTYDSFDPNNFMITNQKYSITASSVLNFWADYGNDSYPDHFGVAVATVDNPTPADFTIVWEGNAKSGDASKSQIRHNGDRYFNWRSHSVSLSAYAGQDVYIAFRHFNSYDQYEIYIDDVELTTGAKNADEMEHFEYYKVMCTSIDGVPIYNHNTPWPFCQLSTNEPYNAPLVEGEHYLCKVASVYSTGMSAWSEPVEWEYEPCDHWGPVDDVTVNTQNDGNHIEWVFEHGFNPYDPGTGGGGGGGGQASFEWYYYDNGVNVDAIGLTSGGSFYWGVMFPAGSYEGHQVSKVSMYDYSANSGTILVYQGGTTAPGTLVGQQAYTCTGSEDFVEWTFGTPATIDPTQNLWIVMNNNNGQYVASCCNNTGDANGRWISLDGAAWEDVATYGLDYTWMLRAYVGDGAKGNYYAAPSMEESGMINNDAYVLNITDFVTFDERVFVAYNLVNDSRFNVVSEGNGMFIISLDNAYEGNLKEAIGDFLAETTSRFSAMDKEQAAETTMAYKSNMSMELTNALMMDVYVKSRENNMCALADPFCTDNGMYEFPAGVNAGSGEAGPDYDCLYTTPNPAWYYMRIGNPGSMDIYMYSTPAVDIDFCCWGPFDDPTTPCPNGLTEDKVVSCSYSANPTEHCMIPASAQTGEYYILVITNYSNQACNINFSMVAGNGSTDCGILPPVDIIGFLITMDGEYLAFAGPTDREYTDIDEFGDHEYCVRPIYPGEMVLPDHNFGWSMGCPVCAGNGGQVTCEPGEPIHADANQTTDEVKVWWGEQIVPIEEWLYYDNGTNDDAIGLTSGGSFYWGIMIPSASLTPYAGTSLTKVAYFDYSAHTGTIRIYQGGSNAPGTQVYTQAYTANGTSDWVEWTLTTPVAIDVTQNLWIVLNNNDGQYVASCCSDTGDANGRWISLDGASWEDVASYGLNDTWNLRGFVTNMAKGGEAKAIEFVPQGTVNGTLSHSGIAKGGSFTANRDRATLVKYNVYRSTDNETYEMIGDVAAVEGQTYYEYIDTPAEGTYYYQVKAYYSNDCESEPAPAFDNPANDYVMVTVTLGIGENDGMAIFPNPTKGNVTIQANGMQHVTVVSVLGQVVYDADVDADELILNMTQFTAGMYTVRVTTENGVHVERITVIR